MKHKFATGLALGALAILALGAGISSNQIGRYQVASGPSIVTIIDTATGRAWSANLSNLNGAQAAFWDAKPDQ